jgi:diguanylate cyclase (GGDEF)-like protein
MKSKTSKRGGVGILIVEDSATQREQLQHLLEEHGYAVASAANGIEALESARRRKPSVIISDIVMPKLDGYGLCKALKSDEALKEVPVVLLTSLADARDVIFGLECGADNFIRKPYQEDYLLHRIDYLLMNLELRRNQKMRMGIEISLGGQRHFITAERQQILDLLISTYEQATHINKELAAREGELARSNEVLNGLYRIAEGLNGATSERQVAETALERALSLPGIQAGWISLREGESGFRLAAARNLPPALEAPGAMEGDCLCRRRLLSGELDSAANIQECERLGRTTGDTQGLRYHAAIPLWVGDRTLGVMNLVGPREGLFSDEELKILYGVGNQVAVALERAQLHEHMERLVEQRTAALTAEVEERKRAEARVTRLNRVYAVLSGINTTIVRTRERQTVFEEACRIAVEHGGFRMAWIGLLDANGLDVTPAARAGIDDGYLDKIRLTARGVAPDSCLLLAEALRKGSPVVCNDVESDARMVRWREAALQRGLRSLVVFPLQQGKKMAGVFLLYAPEKGFFDTEEMKLLSEVAGDISFALDHIEKAERLDYLAYYDVLTGLPNRALFHDRANQLLHAARRRVGTKLALVVLDLERFRTVNETFGRIAGDAVLKQVAERLSAGRLGPDHLARISGDTFAAVLGDLEKEQEALNFVEKRIIDALHQPITVDGQEVRLSAKAGVALFPADGADVDALFRNAEAALKKAKLSGDRYLFYTPELNARAAERLSLENKLRRALEHGELALHYQPKVDLTTGRICGLEALMRWDDPDSGPVPPVKFIPVLEETGLILEAGRWALERAVADSGAWRAKGLPAPRISVNVSAIQLRQKDFVAMVGRVARGAADVLDLEITESLIMQDIEANIEKLKAVRDMGIGVAIDDFGTGYSSLSYIAKLPIDTLKIDRAFILNLTRNPGDVGIVTTIISLAHSLKLKVVAEGVETQEQAKLLRLFKCDEMQGYLFSPAIPAEQVEILLGEGRQLPT